MKILFYISHPAQFHFAKHAIEELKEKGHSIDILAKTKDILTHLIEEKGWEYKNILSRGRGHSKFAICLSLLKRDFKILAHCINRKYDLLVGTDASLAHVGAVLHIPVVTVLEDDYSVIRGLADLTYPFTSCIFTPEVCNIGRWNAKKVGYSGYMKLAYLHPDRFNPDITEIGALASSPYFIIRLSELKAHHDFGMKGITEYYLERIIEKLSVRGKVYITSEKQLPEKFHKYILNIPVSKIHHYLYYADMLICDSQSMAVEAAMLGTPSVRISSFSGKISVLEELEYVYQLTFGFQPERIWHALMKVDELVNIPQLRSEFRNRRQRMLNDKIDVTSYFSWFIENYPLSREIIKEEPEFQLQFRSINLVEVTNEPTEKKRQRGTIFIPSSN